MTQQHKTPKVRPTRATVDGRAFLQLRRLAMSSGRTSVEYIRLYALEGFLLRLSNSALRDDLVLKGGVLLAAYDLRRPTTDIDLAARAVSNDVETIKKIVQDVVDTSLDPGLDDGLVFSADTRAAEVIREGDDYSGVRVHLLASLASAREPIHVDVNVGDPIRPDASAIHLPRLLGGTPLALRGYPMSMVLAEKTVTALERGVPNTRWRDFGDIFAISGRWPCLSNDLRTSLETVAQHRRTPLSPLRETLRGYPAIAQPKWAAWRRDSRLAETLPPSFSEVFDAVCSFVDPVLQPHPVVNAHWSPIDRRWHRPSEAGLQDPEQ